MGQVGGGPRAPAIRLRVPQCPHLVQCSSSVASGPPRSNGKGREGAGPCPARTQRSEGDVQSRERGVYHLVLFCGD